MRTLILPFLLWFAALQLPLPAAPDSLRQAATLISAAGGLASLTVLVYRLGVWRQEMLNLKNNVGAEITRYREETTRNFEQLYRRLDAIDRFIQASAELRVATERWQSKVDTTLATIDTRLTHVEAVTIQS